VFTIIRQDLTGIPKTLLIPLWARAAESQRTDAIIKDPIAVDLVNKINFDFSVFDKEWMTLLVVAIRTEILDREAKAFIVNHPDAIIINLGCGLDTRFFRLDNGKIRWYDLDLPETISVKKQFFVETDRYKLLAKSVFDDSWINDIPRAGEPVLLIAEGLLMYFPEPQIKELFNQLVAVFSGAEMLLEEVSPLFVENSKKPQTTKRFGIDVTFEWGSTSGKELERFNDRIRFISEWNVMDFHKGRWKLMRWIARAPGFKNSFGNRIVRISL
jgi:methyltransferase (TIGR00027 family)